MNYIIDKFTAETQVIINKKANGTWCALPYPGHKKGCPNFGKKKRCPPNVPLMKEGATVMMIGVAFDIGRWASEMKKKHASWTDRQCRCLLYWQGTLRKELRGFLKQAIAAPFTVIYATPEGQGADITAMMKAVGRPLQWPPLTKTWAIVLLGKPEDRVARNGK